MGVIRYVDKTHKRTSRQTGRRTDGQTGRLYSIADKPIKHFRTALLQNVYSFCLLSCAPLRPLCALHKYVIKTTKNKREKTRKTDVNVNVKRTTIAIEKPHGFSTEISGVTKVKSRPSPGPGRGGSWNTFAFVCPTSSSSSSSSSHPHHHHHSVCVSFV